MCTFRKLKANELQCKTTDTKFKGSATILIYKDARCDMRLLDETVGKLNWCKDYKEIDGKVYCGVGIRSKETGEFVWKWDCGTEGNFEAEKSEASDAFKRACFNWGLGRELYDTPKIRIKCPDSYYYNDRLTMTFSVQRIEWDCDNLMQLVIVDRNGKKVYDYTEKEGELVFQKTIPQITDKVIDIVNQKQPKDLLVEFCKKAKAEGEDNEQLGKFYKFYEQKCDTWNGQFNCSKLWENWKSRVRA